MTELGRAFGEAFAMLARGDADLWEIVALSLQVSLSAVVIACLIGMPLGALVAVSRFPGRGLLIVVMNTFMGLPPVVVGLLVYLMISASGPLSPLRLLYTPTAMIIAQTLLVAPIVAALTRQAVEARHREYRELFMVLGLSRRAAVGTLLWDARAALTIAALAGFGRAVAEVGAVMIVGGNINHATRTMTTAITLETSKGEIAVALGLGIVLVLLAFAANALIALIAPREAPADAPRHA